MCAESLLSEGEAGKVKECFQHNDSSPSQQLAQCMKMDSPLSISVQKQMRSPSYFTKRIFIYSWKNSPVLQPKYPPQHTDTAGKISKRWGGDRGSVGTEIYC